MLFVLMTSLGMIILNSLSKAWARINIVRRLKFKIDTKSLQTIYFSFLRPLIEYAAVYNNCAQYKSNEHENKQHEAA